MLDFNRKCNVLLIICLCAVCFFLTACYMPSPLYGVWADNNGNQISFNEDNTYVATLKNSIEEEKVIEGSYKVLMNAITFTRSDGSSLVTEWDIRGNMLYLTWSFSTETINLTLYKVAD